MCSEISLKQPLLLLFLQQYHIHLMLCFEHNLLIFLCRSSLIHFVLNERGIVYTLNALNGSMIDYITRIGYFLSINNL